MWQRARACVCACACVCVCVCVRARARVCVFVWVYACTAAVASRVFILTLSLLNCGDLQDMPIAMSVRNTYNTTIICTVQSKTLD